jgi:hypothetical protein
MVTAFAEPLAWTCRLLGVWSLISTLEWLGSARRWRADGALGWHLLSLRRSRLYRSSLLRWAYAPAPFLAICLTSFLAGAALLVVSAPPAQLAALIALGAASGLLALRGVSDGADKMALVAIAGATLMAAGLTAGDRLLSMAGALWTGGQLTIAYAASGISKALLPGWRDGSIVRRALSSHTLGHPLAYRLLQRPGLAPILGWTVFLPELAFPLALLAPTKVLLGALALFALFHVAIAVAMGLNTYVWAFVAAYPSVLLLGAALRRALGLAD